MRRTIEVGTEIMDRSGNLYLTFVKPFTLGQTLYREMVSFADGRIPATGTHVPAWLMEAIKEKMNNG